MQLMFSPPSGVQQSPLTGELVAERGVVRQGYNPALVNFRHSAYPAFRKALNNVRLGVSNARVLCLGDSTTAGYTGAVSVNQWLTGYPYRVAQQRNSAALAFSAAGFMGNKGIEGQGQQLPAVDSRIAAYASGWSEFATYNIGGRAAWCQSGTNPLLFTPGIASDRLDVYYWDISGNDNVAVGGGTDGLTGGGVITTGGANIVKLATVTQAGTTKWGMRRNGGSGSIWIQGAVAYSSVLKEVQLINGGIGGISTAQCVDTQYPYSIGNALSTAGGAYTGIPLVVISLGINDGYQAIPVATTKTNIQTLINACKSGGSEVLLMVPNPCITSTWSLAAQQALRAAYFELAMVNNLTLVDTWQVFVDFATANAQGLYGDASVHPSALGYQDMAGLMSRFLLELSP
jgi:lysophospholipase L1-like esterase